MFTHCFTCLLYSITDVLCVIQINVASLCLWYIYHDLSVNTNSFSATASVSCGIFFKDCIFVV